MIISKIQKNDLLNAPQQKTAGFGHSRKKSEKHRSSDEMFANMSDLDLYRTASVLPNERYRKVKNNAAGTLFVGIPVLDTLAAGIVQKGGLASKAKEMIKRAGIWGAVFSAAAGLVLLKHKVNKESAALNNIDRNHPVLRTCMDMTFAAGVLLTASALAKKAGSFINKNYGKTIEKIKAPIRNFVNNSKINKRIVTPLDNALTKAAKGNRAPLNIAAAYTAPVLLAGLVTRLFAEDSSRQINIKTNYQTLKNLQTLVRNSADKSDKAETV